MARNGESGCLLWSKAALHEGFCATYSLAGVWNRELGFADAGKTDYWCRRSSWNRASVCFVTVVPVEPFFPRLRLI
jgi:hypothetical protein